MWNAGSKGRWTLLTKWYLHFQLITSVLMQIAVAVRGNSAETEFGLPIAELFITNNTETGTLRLITNVSDTEVVISKDLIMNGPFYNQIVMFCNASYPVEWAYEGDGVS